MVKENDMFDYKKNWEQNKHKSTPEAEKSYKKYWKSIWRDEINDTISNIGKKVPHEGCESQIGCVL